MDSIASHLDPKILAQLKGLRLRARQIVEGYVAGLHRSPFRGFSIEFAEHREYAPGDDLRYVDWKVYGRTDKYYVKQFEDETNLICYVVLDASESMRYQGPGVAMSKFTYAQCLAAAISFLVLLQHDAVSVATFDDRVRHFVRPAGSPAQQQQVLAALEDVEPVAKTNMERTFRELAERMVKRGIVLVMSDFFHDTRSMLAGLRHFQYRRHDVALLQVLDPCELDFPFRGSTLFRGMEQLPDLLADPAALRTAYLQEFNHFLQTVKSGAQRMGIDYRLIRTDQSFDKTLASFLAHRAAKTG